MTLMSTCSDAGRATGEQTHIVSGAALCQVQGSDQVHVFVQWHSAHNPRICKPFTHGTRTPCRSKDLEQSPTTL
eukprot:1100108-Pelagomonas_calceolata.AAC.1